MHSQSCNFIQYFSFTEMLTEIMGEVRRPQAKNSKNITTKAWYTLGSIRQELCKHKHQQLLYFIENITSYFNCIGLMSMQIAFPYIKVLLRDILPRGEDILEMTIYKLFQGHFKNWGSEDKVQGPGKVIITVSIWVTMHIPDPLTRLEPGWTAYKLMDYKIMADKLKIWNHFL